MQNNHYTAETAPDEAERITEIAGRLIEADPGLSPQDADKQAAAIIEKEKRRARSPFKLAPAGNMPLLAPEWLVKGFIEKNSFGVLYGAFGTAKSFAALDYAFSIGTGTATFHGAETKAGPVIYIAGEGWQGLVRRLRAWELVRGRSIKDAPVFFSNCPANLCDAEFFLYVKDAVTAIAEQGAAPSLIIIDTWSRNLAGDENSSLDSARAVQALDELRAPYNCAVLVVHHSGWDKSRTRGSTVLMAAADFAFSITKEKDSPVSLLECQKMKDGRTPDPICFDLQDISLGVFGEDGEELGSAAVRCRPDIKPAEKSASRSTGSRMGINQKAALDCLKSIWLKQAVFNRAAGIDADPKISVDSWKEEISKSGIDRRRRSDVIRSLEKTGDVVLDDGFVYLNNPPELGEAVTDDD